MRKPKTTLVRLDSINGTPNTMLVNYQAQTTGNVKYYICANTTVVWKAARIDTSNWKKR